MRPFLRTAFIFCLPFCLIFRLALASEVEPLHLYLDADLSNHRESSRAIQLGIEVAMKQVGNRLNGVPVKFVYLDHRGNVVRSKMNYQKFLSDPQGLAIYSGIHSPPLIKNRAFINENAALTLVPWAAGGPITRYPSPKNWVFRLSVDDTKAGAFLVDYAFSQKNCKNPLLLLEKTPWGDSNLVNMTQELESKGIAQPDVLRFGWGLAANGARKIFRTAESQKNDCILLVANAIEGAVLLGELSTLPKSQRLPVVSHWGIASGNFHVQVPFAQREKIDLSFIQTCFSFKSDQLNEFAKKAWQDLIEHSDGEIKTPLDLYAEVGFVHAYDLTRLLIQAVSTIKFTGDIKVDRDRVRLALETMEEPVLGLTKTYRQPFSVFDAESNYDAHEALNEQDYCMAYFGRNNEVVLVE